MIVLDASAAVELVLQTPVGARLAERLLVPEMTLAAPHLIDLEVAQVLRRFARRGELAPEQARNALEILAGLRLERYSHRLLWTRIWELRENLTSYDAAYVALAEALGAALLTRDARLLAAPGHGARVEVV